MPDTSAFVIQSKDVTSNTIRAVLMTSFPTLRSLLDTFFEVPSKQLADTPWHLNEAGKKTWTIFLHFVPCTTQSWYFLFVLLLLEIWVYPSHFKGSSLSIHLMFVLIDSGGIPWCDHLVINQQPTSWSIVVVHCTIATALLSLNLLLLLLLRPIRPPPPSSMLLSPSRRRRSRCVAARIQLRGAMADTGRYRSGRAPVHQPG